MGAFPHGLDKPHGVWLTHFMNEEQEEQRKKDALHGDLMILGTAGSLGLSMAGAIANAMGWTSFPWWLIMIVGAPGTVVLGVCIFAVVMFIYTMNKHG